MSDEKEVSPYGEIYEIQINDMELYAFEPLICDAICANELTIADARRKLGILTEVSEQTEMLSTIQQCEGKNVIFKGVLDQLGMPWER